MSAREKEIAVISLLAVGFMLGVALAGTLVSWWLTLGLWLGLGLAGMVWYIATKRVKFAELTWTTTSGKFVGSLLLGPWMAASIIVFVSKRHLAAIKMIAKAACWGLLTGLLAFFSYHSDYWGFFATMWYLSGLLVIKLAIREGVTEDMTKTRKFIGVVFAFVGGTFLLALLNTAQNIPFRQPQTEPTTG
ncbi:MAG: hypothetical protein AAB541_00265 [Patescibacteria group bacterium]